MVLYLVMADLWRVVEGIERDGIENIRPWLRQESTIPGDPPDRSIEHIERLLEILYENQMSTR